MKCPFCNERSTTRADGFIFCSDYMTCSGRIENDEWVTTCLQCSQTVRVSEITLREAVCTSCQTKEAKP